MKIFKGNGEWVCRTQSFDNASGPTIWPLTEEMAEMGVGDGGGDGNDGGNGDDGGDGNDRPRPRHMSIIPQVAPTHG